MDIALSESEQAFRDEVRAFIRARLPQEIRERLRLGHPPRKQDTVAWQRILHERGWAAPHWPRAFGGAELGQLERLILMDELYRAPAPLPQVFNITMLGPVLMKFGTRQQQEHFLPRLARLDLWFCQGFSEPGAGSDLASLRTSARRDGEDYIVNGQKIWTTGGHDADYVWLACRTDADAPKHKGISILIVPTEDAGFEWSPINTVGGLMVTSTYYSGIRVPSKDVVGEVNGGWQLITAQLNHERIGLAAIGGRTYGLWNLVLDWAKVSPAWRVEVLIQVWSLVIAGCQRISMK